MDPEIRNHLDRYMHFAVLPEERHDFLRFALAAHEADPEHVENTGWGRVLDAWLAERSAAKPTTT